MTYTLPPIRRCITNLGEGDENEGNALSALETLINDEEEVYLREFRSHYDPPTVPGMFMHQARRRGDRVLKVSKQGGVWTPTTWRESYDGLRCTTLGLVAPDDLATIAYTSGATGPPKGAMITHANLYHTAIHAVTTQNLDEDDFGIAYLPLTHMLQRLTVYAVLHSGVRGVYAESIEKLIDNFRELKPTIQVGVPRIFEKIHARIMQRIAAASPEAFASHPAIRRLVEEHVAAVNARLAPYETIKRFAILPLDFTEAAGELTPTLKIRRREITRKYRNLLDNLYEK